MNLVGLVTKDELPRNPIQPSVARKLLKQGRARIYSYRPVFTIQMLEDSFSEDTKVLVFGIDAGYGTIGYSVVSETEEITSGEVVLLKGMRDRLTERKMYRRTRRSRIRHRASRFLNRRRKHDWLAPSIQHKVDSHLKLIRDIDDVLPLEKIVIEVGTFDPHKLLSPKVSGKGYLEGIQQGWDNLRACILFRDNHRCQNLKCSGGSDVLHVHHIMYRSKGGTNSPSNLITLCSLCHTQGNHKEGGLLYEWMTQSKRMSNGIKEATFMNVIKNFVANRLYSTDDRIRITHGYRTKQKRLKHNVEKSHANDAFVIAGGKRQTRCVSVIKVQRRQNIRKLSLFVDAKYIDVRDGTIKSGSALNCGRTIRNTKLIGENLRKYRGEQVRKGRVQVKSGKSPLEAGTVVRFKESSCIGKIAKKRRETVKKTGRHLFVVKMSLLAQDHVRLIGLKGNPRSTELEVVRYP